MDCTCCGDALDSEELENPREDKQGDILCDDCFENKYTHRCPVCEGLFNEDFSVKITPKNLLISESVGEQLHLDTGVYEIVEYPFYRDGITEFSLITSSIKKITDLPSDFTDEELNTLHYICDECMKKATEAEEAGVGL